MKLMSLINKILFLFLSTLSFISFSQDKIQRDDSHLYYLEEESNEINVDPSVFYYVSDSSSNDFMQNMRASLLSFVKNDFSTSIDDMKLLKNENELDFNSSCSVSQISFDLILKNLNDEKNYNGLKIKTIDNGVEIDINSNTLKSIIFYSYKLRYLIAPYLDKAKELKSDHGIDYIIISMDTDKLISLKDSYQNLPIGY